MVKDKISILMAVYNAEDYLRQAIDSVLAQTYTNWQFIICNDCSTDGTQVILDEYKKIYPDKFVLIRNEKNSRLAFSLNHCLEYADGEFSARMDGDDYIAPDKFEKQINYLRTHTELQLCGTLMQTFDGNDLGRVIAYKEFPDKTDLRHGPVFAHATIMMYTEVYKALGGYTVCARTARSQDYDLWFKFFAAGYKGGMLQEPLYYVREDANAYLRRKAKLYLWAVVTRWKGFNSVKMPIYYYPYVLAPIVAMIRNEARKIVARKKIHTD